MKKNVDLRGEINLAGTVSVRRKYSFSKQHFNAARYFARASEYVETAFDQPTEDERSQHRAYVSGSILFCVAALESSVNELFLEALDKNKSTLDGLTNAQIESLASKWATSEKESVLEKYQIALDAVRRDRFDQGSAPFQGVDSLVYLRNALVHFKPEWDEEARVHNKIQARLGGKFRLNPFATADSPWFPHRCLGSGCAQWALDVTSSFMNEFCRKLGITNRL